MVAKFGDQAVWKKRDKQPFGSQGEIVVFAKQILFVIYIRKIEAV